MLLSLILVLPLLFLSALAQSFSLPSTWQNVSITGSYDGQQSLAEVAFPPLIDKYKSGTLSSQTSNFTSGVLFYEMARFDQVTNQTTYKDELQLAFSSVERENPTFSFQTIYGYAAAQAYQTYNDMNYLNLAEESWLTGSGYAIQSPGQITISGKNSTFEIECNGTSMIGGVFETTTENDLYIGGTSTGYFLVLSSLLANVTSNQTYLDTALQSADFIRNHLTNSNNLVMDGIFADTCGPGSNNQGAAISSPNSGLAIEGLSTLTSTTQNNTIQNWMEQTVSSAVLDSPWNNGNGIMTENTHFNLITGYVAAFEHTTNNALRQFAKGYLSIQYNAVLENAAINGSSSYGDSWTKPQTTHTDPGQISALTILVNAMVLNRTDDTANTEPPPSTSTSVSDPKPPSKKNNTGIIVGSVTGSLGFILGVVATFIYFRKRHRKDQKRSLQTPTIPTSQYSYYDDSSRADTDTSYQRDRSSTNFGPGYHATETHWNLRRNEKRSLQDSNSSSSAQQAPSSNLSSVPDQHPVPQSGIQGTRAVSTEQLVRMLAERMQGEVQDGDLPPAYHSH
ncbi:hypothetical protein K435DRAFT_834281 [Dendrothele bispora CBS 962.96]|uniref:Glycoside hydrolase family 76 protein n=1 Tax=Dendrothele bispora (strain CBS 962.96) TaxID=1314807 RepID=A0A4S8MV97_DENBC|nr:hypothetical protein K435DRAFT_834281 [Dendrothele bispora CBS 962.96]